MNLFGTFIICLILLCLVLAIGWALLPGWSVIILAALILAVGIHMYMELSDRLDTIERHLGLKQEETAPLTEQLKDDETAP